MKTTVFALLTLFLITFTGCATKGGSAPGTGLDPLPPDGEFYIARRLYTVKVPQGYVLTNPACPDCYQMVEVSGSTMDGIFSVKVLTPSDPDFTHATDCEMVYDFALGPEVTECGPGVYDPSCASVVVTGSKAGHDADPNGYQACGAIQVEDKGLYRFSIDLDARQQAQRFDQLIAKVTILLH